MEGNKDEAEKCILLAEKYMKAQNREKSEKFLYKAERLYPTQKAKDLLLQLNVLAPKVSDPQTEQPHRRMSQDTVPEYTAEQAESVKRIQSCTDYYEMLGVSRDVTDSEIKKCYKKLALQLHPDKNKFPGSAEAFKVVGNAFTVLTDVERRKQYDQFGPDVERESYQRKTTSHARRPYESDATAEEFFNMSFGREESFNMSFGSEELFNMSFGGGFNRVYVRNRGRWQRHNNAANSGQENRSQNNREQQSLYSTFIGILPILLAIILSMALLSFMFSDRAYSLQASSKYPVLRKTRNLDIPYYVQENSAVGYQESVRRLEMSVEQEYVTNLKHACYREKNYRDSLLWRAKNFGDKDLYQTAQNMPLESCRKLHDLHNHG